MTIQCALLRAVNVGGHAKLPMADLRALAERAGLEKVRSLLQSGNLVFDAGGKSPAASEKLLETACAAKFGLETKVHVRMPAEIDALMAQNPFPEQARDDPGRRVVLFLRAAPEAKAFKALQAAIKGRERVRGDGRHAFIVYPDGQGNSKLTGAVIERYFGLSGTARNWNTVSKLAAMMKA